LLNQFSFASRAAGHRRSPNDVLQDLKVVLRQALNEVALAVGYDRIDLHVFDARPEQRLLHGLASREGSRSEDGQKDNSGTCTHGACLEGQLIAF
jgi:hypothetical protein